MPDDISSVAHGTVAEPLGKGIKQTGKPCLGFGANNPIIRGIIDSLFEDSRPESTIIEPKEGLIHRGRPTICWPTGPKLQDGTSGEGRKTGLYEKMLRYDGGDKLATADELEGFASKMGIDVKYVPRAYLQRRYGADYIGYRDGNTIYVAEDLEGNKRIATIIHELFENQYETHKKCQSAALEFARRAFPEAYETLWLMGRAIGIN